MSNKPIQMGQLPSRRAVFVRKCFVRAESWSLPTRPDYAFLNDRCPRGIGHSRWSHANDRDGPDRRRTGIET